MNTDLCIVSLIFSLSFLATLIIGYIVIKLSFSRDLIGRDVHKFWESYASDIGGLSLIAAPIIATLFYPSRENLAILLSSLISLAIGLYDDLYVLSGRVKPLVSIIASIPVIVLGVYSPYPRIPLLGEARLTILYPLVIAIGYSIALNAFNMSDTHNGLIIGVSLITLSVLTPYIAFVNPTRLSTLLSLTASLSAFLLYNAYPAKSFVGNSGSFILGSWFASIAFIERIEFLLIIALLPLIINGFSILTTIGGFKERREIKKRPVSVVKGLIYGNRDPDAPITLTNIASLRRPIKETDYVVSIYILSLISSVLGLIIWISLA
ncbi:MAG: hypothetical protein ABWJ42_04125 [Sulfolobales archaeon]